MKRFFTIILMIMSLTVFSSCGSGGNNGNNQKPPEKAKPPESSQPPVQTEYKVSDFFPFTKDLHIKYKGKGNEYAEFETYVEYVKDNIMQIRNINPGTSMAFVYEIGGGMLKKVFSKGEVYYKYDFTSQKGDEEILIKEPVKVGTEWTLKDGAKRSITSTDKEVSTPLGKYKALEVTTLWPDSTIHEYYAKDVGLIKRDFTPKNSKDSVTSEIEKLEKDVPFKQTLRFFFPNVAKDKIYHIDRVIESKTNEDMKFKFQKELKTIPEGSGLSKVLTINTQVLGTVVDDKKGTVTVNFSPHLISEANLGSSAELMMLQSIANTFGSYYQSGKVIITLDGKPYSSGHILMKPGEFFKVDIEHTVPYK